MADIDTAFGWGNAIASLLSTDADLQLLASWSQDVVDEFIAGHQLNASAIAFLLEYKAQQAAIQTHWAT